MQAHTISQAQDGSQAPLSCTSYVAIKKTPSKPSPSASSSKRYALTLVHSAYTQMLTMPFESPEAVKAYADSLVRTGSFKVAYAEAALEKPAKGRASDKAGPLAVLDEAP